MSLARLATPFEGTLGVPALRKDVLSELNTGDPMYLVKSRMDGSQQAYYHINLIHLLDKVFLNDAINFLSIEQERFMSRFFSEAGEVTTLLNLHTEEDVDPYENISSIMKQLDSFLGSYYGENNE